MTKLLAFFPGNSRQVGLASGNPRQVGLASSNSRQVGLASGNSRQVGLFSGNSRQVGLFSGNSIQQKTASSFRLFRPTAAMQFFFFQFLFRQDFASRSISSQALTPKPITISGSHTQTNHNFRLSHPSQSQPQALTSTRRSTRSTVPSDHHYDKP